MDIWMMLSVALPSAAGIILLAVSFLEHVRGKEKVSVKGLYVYTADRKSVV